MKDILPRAKRYLERNGRAMDKYNQLNHLTYFEMKWKNYLHLRRIDTPNQQPVFPTIYGPKERDQFYTSMRYRWI
jgi:hypothetical protein